MMAFTHLLVSVIFVAFTTPYYPYSEAVWAGKSGSNFRDEINRITQRAHHYIHVSWPIFDQSKNVFLQVKKVH